MKIKLQTLALEQNVPKNLMHQSLYCTATATQFPSSVGVVLSWTTHCFQKLLKDNNGLLNITNPWFEIKTCVLPYKFDTYIKIGRSSLLIGALFLSVYIMPNVKSCIAVYRTRAIIGRSRFEAALIYKPSILGLKNEEFPILVHKLSAI